MINYYSLLIFLFKKFLIEKKEYNTAINVILCYHSNQYFLKNHPYDYIKNIFQDIPLSYYKDVNIQYQMEWHWAFISAEWRREYCYFENKIAPYILYEIIKDGKLHLFIKNSLYLSFFTKIFLNSVFISKKRKRQIIIQNIKNTLNVHSLKYILQHYELNSYWDEYLENCKFNYFFNKKNNINSKPEYDLF